MSSESRCNRVGSKHIDVPVNAFTLFAATGPSLRQFLVDIMPWSRGNSRQEVFPRGSCALQTIVRTSH
jgi:hypothetical protein